MSDLTDDEMAFLQGAFDRARDGDTSRLAEYVDAGLPVNLTNAAGDSLLILAAYHTHLETVRALLDRGADTDRVNDRGQTALSAAVFRRSGPIVSALLDAGADPAVGAEVRPGRGDVLRARRHGGAAAAPRRRRGCVGVRAVLLRLHRPTGLTGRAGAGSLVPMSARPSFSARPLTPDTFGDLESLFARPGGSIVRGCWCMYYRLTGTVSVGAAAGGTHREQLRDLAAGQVARVWSATSTASRSAGSASARARTTSSCAGRR